MLALKLTPPANPDDDAPLRPGDQTNLVLGWITTAIPRVGTTIPF
jgi:hypothetical protein